MKVILTITLLLLSISSFADIVKLKEKLEISTGCKLVITSADRTPEHNHKIGGAKNSYHLQKGMALDLVKSECTLSYKQIAIHAKELFNGIIWYKTHIHVDLRKGKKVFFGK